MRLTAVLVSLAASSLALSACSKNDQGTTPPDTTAAVAEPADHESGHESGHEGEGHDGEGHEPGGHEHGFEGPVDAFHSAMAPLWHAPAGEARTTDTCAAVGDLIAKAEAIQSAEVPAAASDATAWQTESEELVAATRTLENMCKDAPEQFDSAFESLHEAFHALVALVGHEEKGQ